MPKRVFQTVGQGLKLSLRSQQIGFMFYRYGIGGSLAALGFEAGKRGLRWTKLAQPPTEPYDAVFGKALAHAFVKLGPTFIKLGQVMATRPDFVGDAIAEELKVLYDRVPAITFKQVQKILRKELGVEQVAKAFQSIDPKPLASASISQTHHAVLANGTPVILKVQKKGVSEVIRLDLTLLEGIIRSLALVYPKLHLNDMFKEFKDGTLAEIDYREEAKNIDQFQKNYRSFFSDSDVVFPSYVPELTTERVIVLEPMHGKKFTDLKKGSTVARNAATKSLATVLEQIFDHGFFHADPHAGNLFFMEDEGRLGFIDLGLVGQLHPEDKRRFLKVLMAILKRDREKLARALFELGTPSVKTKFDDFEKEIQELLDEVKATGIDKVRMDQLVNKLLQVARRNGILVPNRYILMIRSCLMIEGVARSLDPKLSMFDIAIPIVARSLAKSYNPLNFFVRRQRKL